MDPDPNFPGWIPMFGWSWSGSGLRIKNSNPDSEKGHGFKRLFFLHTYVLQQYRRIWGPLHGKSHSQPLIEPVWTSGMPRLYSKG